MDGDDPDDRMRAGADDANDTVFMKRNVFICKVCRITKTIYGFISKYPKKLTKRLPTLCLVIPSVCNTCRKKNILIIYFLFKFRIGRM